jgi:hypothetical protein
MKPKYRLTISDENLVAKIRFAVSAKLKHDFEGSVKRNVKYLNNSPLSVAYSNENTLHIMG